MRFIEISAREPFVFDVACAWALNTREDERSSYRQIMMAHEYLGFGVVFANTLLEIPQTLGVDTVDRCTPLVVLSLIVQKLKQIFLSKASQEWIFGPAARGSFHQLLWDPNPERRGRQGVINALREFDRCPQYLRADHW
jgi:hypothetical protein